MKDFLKGLAAFLALAAIGAAVYFGFFYDPVLPEAIIMPFEVTF